ncbi:hypothetical protein [Streptomyces sp. NPDC093225]|uniref:hypothetical protein n=1 Tax=Streptomyces sp. NPDC093225 TaxID=3366034 RepID=UPI0037F5F585
MPPCTRRFRSLLVLASVLAAAAAYGPASPASAAPAPVPHARAAPADDEEPCPGGEPKPCSAAPAERDTVEADRKGVTKDSGEAEKEIDKTREQIDKCPPESKTCMTGLTGAGTDEHAGMKETRGGLDAFEPAPRDNATGAVNGACAAFGAELPAELGAPGGPSAFTGVCELMQP